MVAELVNSIAIDAYSDQLEFQRCTDSDKLSVFLIER
ncbi:unnamed protein product [Rhodiola kirilowii]